MLYKYGKIGTSCNGFNTVLSAVHHYLPTGIRGNGNAFRQRVFFPVPHRATVMEWVLVVVADVDATADSSYWHKPAAPLRLQSWFQLHKRGWQSADATFSPDVCDGFSLMVSSRCWRRSRWSPAGLMLCRVRDVSVWTHTNNLSIRDVSHSHPGTEKCDFHDVFLIFTSVINLLSRIKPCQRVTSSGIQTPHSRLSFQLRMVQEDSCSCCRQWISSVAWAAAVRQVASEALQQMFPLREAGADTHFIICT